MLGTFTALGVSATWAIENRQPHVIAVTGGYFGTVILERELDGGRAWSAIQLFGGLDDPLAMITENGSYRLRCSYYGQGTASFEVLPVPPAGPVTIPWSTITSTPTTLVGYGISPAQSSAARSLNTIFQISATRLAFVAYSVQITITASITGGQNGDIVLEIASDAAFTTNVQTLGIFGAGQVYTLAIALQGIQPQTLVLWGFVPAAYYTRLRTVNNTGTPGFAYRAGQETLL